MDNPTSNTDALANDGAEIEQTAAVEQTAVDPATAPSETSNEQNIFATERSVQPWVLGAATVVAGIATCI